MARVAAWASLYCKLLHSAVAETATRVTAATCCQDRRRRLAVRRRATAIPCFGRGDRQGRGSAGLGEGDTQAQELAGTLVLVSDDSQ